VQDPVTQTEQRVEFLPRQPHETEEDGGGELLGELLREVAFTTLDEFVDEVVRSGGDVV
jgi:hypothetical protein